MILPTQVKSQEIPQTVSAPITEHVWTTPELQSFARTEANKYDIDGSRFESVIACESGWNEDAIGDHGTSYGLVQIHLPDHPDITKAQAEDPEFALDWAAKVWSRGGEHQWSCYDM